VTPVILGLAGLWLDTLCTQRLAEMNVHFAVPERPVPGVVAPIEVLGPLGGVTYVADGKPRPLVLDCSLVYSLARAGRFFVDAGLGVAVWIDAYHVRNIKGTNRPSKHSYGLAIDVMRWLGPCPKGRAGCDDDRGHTLVVEQDYEQGLGRGRDCIGRPSTERARTLRTLWCRLARSELFRVVLDPDYDDDHRDHFHLDALPWGERQDLDDP
jgi:hypothetical protein